ncbi:MAG: orotate phosphoribosyltransferase [Alphaproteobacteria bacterium]|nr:orotate phosphoribosyltransferase [Alphaproteobacteria bacterium]
MKEIAALLLDIQAVKLSPNAPFTWASGWKSPIYCNNRKVLSYPIQRSKVVYALVKLIPEVIEIDAIIGVATGAIAWGGLVADELNLPFGYVRSEKKDHGLKTQIEGFESLGLKGKKVIVVEDLISTGGSSLKAVQVLREAGAEVIGMVAIFSYLFPQAEKAFAEAGVELKTITNYSELLEVALEQGFVKKEDTAWLAEWRKSPETWGQHQN